MNCGDIVFTYSKTVLGSDVKPYIAYDKNLLIGAGLLGTELKSRKLISLEGLKFTVLQLKDELSYSQRKKLSEHLLNIIHKKEKLSLTERLNFVKYIDWIYKNILKIDLFKHPSIPVGTASILKSELLLHEESDLLNKEEK